MPLLLLRDGSSASISAVVEKACSKVCPVQEYDLRLNNGELELSFLSKFCRKITSTSTDEGFESDIDTSSIVSSDNDSFSSDKITKHDSKSNENDSANGSDNEAPESGNFEKNQTDPGKSVCSMQQQISQKFNLVDCMCYMDIKCNDILIFVIKKETFVFQFVDMDDLRTFYTKFTTYKAMANQNSYEGRQGHNFNLPQRTGQLFVTNVPFRHKLVKPFTENTEQKFMSISNPSDISVEYKDRIIPKQQDTTSNSKFSTLSTNLSLGSKNRTPSSSIVDSLGLDVLQRNLVKESNMKVWNSAEDLLDSPKRPQRKKKRRAPEPPLLTREKQDIMSGQYVRVNVNLDSVDCVNNHRVVVKTSSNDEVPKKNFSSMFSTKSSIKSFLKPKEKEILRYEPRVGDYYSLQRNAKTLNRSWNRTKFDEVVKPKPDFQKFVDCKFVETKKSTNQLACPNVQKNHVRNIYPVMSHNLVLSQKLRSDIPVQTINRRLFGLSSKLKDYSDGEGGKKSLWGSHTKKDITLKSVIKGNKEEATKKKNDKKVTFSTYTTVQVV